ncbi:MAG: GlmU family protein [Flavobacteriales bacterium]
MQIIFFDLSEQRKSMLPLSYTRVLSDLRIGILKISEKWTNRLGIDQVSYLTEDYLQEKFPCYESDENIFIQSNICPNDILLGEIMRLEDKDVLMAGETILAFRGTIEQFMQQDWNYVEYNGEFLQVSHPWEIFQHNGSEMEYDFAWLTAGRNSEPISGTNRVLNPSQVFIEPGAQVECAILNANNGPIYIGKDAEVMEGSVVRGPFALCEHGVLKLATKIYGPTTIGPHSKVGGEVNNSVILGYSNKGHDGFLGNSVLGEWCNIGADSNNSNLKNNYAEVRLWSYASGRYAPTSLQFCGLIMGDHSKCGINTMFNTGTVVGVSSNIFGGGFPRNFIPSFSWGGSAGFTEYKLNKVFEVAEKVMERRSIDFDEVEQNILKAVFERSAQYRSSYK